MNIFSIKPRVTVIENPKNDEDKVKPNFKKKEKDVKDEISESKFKQFLNHTLHCAQNTRTLFL